VFINNNKIDTRDVTFTLQKDDQGNSTLQPCFNVDDLKASGSKPKNIRS
jgi:outer membrane usher protein